jgi:poly-beta-1,6-N-acetyl-D-glucosamine synthase
MIDTSLNSQSSVSLSVKTLSYVLITPARNEDAFIEKTIESVTSQTVLPLKWVIVSDGSTDSTEEVVKRYTPEYPWIELVSMPERAERHFAGKVMAFNAGLERVGNLQYDIVGNLDADLSFESDYFEFLLDRFAENPRLGVAGTPFVEGSVSYNYHFTSTEHVSGACQLFRRSCFETIGGYVPLKEGGIDLVAVVTARMRGWQTRTFTQKTCEHHRKMGSGKHGVLTYAWRGGYHDYLMAVHPAWQVIRFVHHLAKRPYVVWAVLLLAGYLWGAITRAKRPVSNEFVDFRRGEQMRRLRGFLRMPIGGDAIANSPETK